MEPNIIRGRHPHQFAIHLQLVLRSEFAVDGGSDGILPSHQFHQDIQQQRAQSKLGAQPVVLELREHLLKQRVILARRRLGRFSEPFNINLLVKPVEFD